MSFLQITSFIVVINLMLMIFNLVPLPPLDGSKILFSILPNQYGRFRATLEAFSPILMIFTVFFLWQFVVPVIPFLFRVITGVGY